MVAGPAAPARAEPGTESGTEPESISALLTEFRDLYCDAEAAGEAYNDAAERLRAQRERVAELSDRLARTRGELADARQIAGQLAREQYRGGGFALPASLRLLLLGDDAGGALHDQAVAARAATTHVATLEQLGEGERRTARLAREEREALDAAQALASEQRRHRDEARRRMDEVAGLLAGLPEERLAELAELERAETARAQDEFLGSGALGDDAAAPSSAGERALGYAREQLGKPYAWGAEGPGSFDCSGLTSQAWSRAGVTIPRTSQEQWSELPRVPLDRLRPGDLVVYFEDATHVALYAGDGTVVHAPRPGAAVKVSPIAASGPVEGAVRPDAAA
ncbi:NlpC/P60 family protein [Streptomyces sp. 6N223]|uniref:NlpC/P60 family protein n=1 Tax=Streptomyces sp. 6N223 TaxID=3457412 RepID=UPI003FD02D4A